MDPRHRELARIGLAAAQDYGFALAGGYALAMHSLVDRATEDVDLFTNHLDSDEFTRAAETISAAYEEAGPPVTVVRRAELYARQYVGPDDPCKSNWCTTDGRGSRPDSASARSSTARRGGWQGARPVGTAGCPRLH